MLFSSSKYVRVTTTPKCWRKQCRAQNNFYHMQFQQKKIKFVYLFILTRYHEKLCLVWQCVIRNCYHTLLNIDQRWKHWYFLRGIDLILNMLAWTTFLPEQIFLSYWAEVQKKNKNKAFCCFVGEESILQKVSKAVCSPNSWLRRY